MKRRFGMMIAAVFCAAALCAAPAFCEEAETEKEILQIGQKASDTDYQVMMTNSTGKEITSVAICVDEGDYSDNLLPEGEVFPDQAQAMLIFPPAELKEGQTKAPRYDVELQFADGLRAGLHTFPFGDADAVTILLDELTGDDLDEGTEQETVEIAYIRFTSKSLGSEQDTQWHEWDVVAPGKAGEAAAAYAAKIAAQQAAAAPAYWSDDTDTSYSYDAPADGGNGAGNTEKCLNGGLLN